MKRFIPESSYSLLLQYVGGVLLFIFFVSIPTHTVQAAWPDTVGDRPVYLQNVTINSIDIVWKTASGGSSAVKYGMTASYELGTVNGTNGRKTIDNQPGFLHTARISGLATNTKYFYQVVSGGVAITPAGDASYVFKTSPATGSTTPFTWAVLGDPGSNSTGQKNVAALVNSRKPDLYLLPGDVVYGAGYGGYPSLSGEPQQDANYFNIYANTSRLSPVYFVCGNHDNNDNTTPNGTMNGCDIARDEHVMPQGGQAVTSTNKYDDVIYSFNYGNIHFTILNINPESGGSYTSPTVGDAQMKWAYTDIVNSSQPWKILMYHTNNWSAGSHATNAKTPTNVAVLAQDAGVNFVMTGHSHVYERFSRFAAQGHAGCSVSGGCRDKGPYWYTIGNSGSGQAALSCGSFTNGPQCIAASGIGGIPGGVGFMFVQTNGNAMTLNYIDQNGTTYDTVTRNLSEFGPNPPTSTPGVVVTSPTPTRTPTPPPGTPTRTPTPGGAVPGDANGDGHVTGADYAIWVAHYGQTVTNGAASGDFNNNGLVNGADYSIWLVNYGR